MAAGYTFVCSFCARAVEGWDEGHPYVRTAAGRKRYVYHPDPERDQAVGVDADYLCLACARAFRADAGAVPACPRCAATDVSSTYRLAGCRCPYCQNGTFGDSVMTSIS